MSLREGSGPLVQWRRIRNQQLELVPTRTICAGRLRDSFELTARSGKRGREACLSRPGESREGGPAGWQKKARISHTPFAMRRPHLVRAKRSATPAALHSLLAFCERTSTSRRGFWQDSAAASRKKKKTSERRLRSLNFLKFRPHLAFLSRRWGRRGAVHQCLPFEERFPRERTKERRAANRQQVAKSANWAGGTANRKATIATGRQLTSAGDSTRRNHLTHRDRHRDSRHTWHRCAEEVRTRLRRACMDGKAAIS